jgi:predicted regulator of Ras-like GTPase activity (Roadblock/LC7/MglB family)
MMANATIRTAIGDLKTRLSAIGVALVSRDGQVLCSELPAGVYAETFAIMCATVLGAAVTAHRELDRRAPERVVIEGPDSTTVIAGCGRKALLIAMVDATTETTKLLGEIAKFSDLLEVN